MEHVQNTEKSTPQSVRLNELLRITDQLSDVLSEEIDLLNARPEGLAEEIALIQQKKTGLSRIYEGHIEFLRENPDFFRNIAPESKEKLKIASKEFAELVKENARLLDITKKTSERVANTIITAIRRETAKGATYSDAQNQAPGALGSQSYTLNTEI